MYKYEFRCPGLLYNMQQPVLGTEAHFGFGRLSASRPKNKNVFGFR